MLGAIMDHVASLAEGREVGVRVVAGVVIAMGGREHDARPARTPEHIVDAEGEAHPLAAPITPSAAFGIPPSAVAQMVDDPPMRPPAALTAALGPVEPDHDRELRPVYRIEEAVLAPDRHEIGLFHTG